MYDRVGLMYVCSGGDTNGTRCDSFRTRCVSLSLSLVEWTCMKFICRMAHKNFFGFKVRCSFFFMFTANAFFLFFFIVVRCICLIEPFVDMRCGCYLVVYISVGTTSAHLLQHQTRARDNITSTLRALGNAWPLDLFHIMGACHLFFCTSRLTDRPPVKVALPSRPPPECWERVRDSITFIFISIPF